MAAQAYDKVRAALLVFPIWGAMDVPPGLYPKSVIRPTIGLDYFVLMLSVHMF